MTQGALSNGKLKRHDDIFVHPYPLNRDTLASSAVINLEVEDSLGVSTKFTQENNVFLKDIRDQAK